MRMLESFFLRKATRCLFRTKTSSALHSVLIRSVSGSLALFVFLPTLLQARIGESYPAVLDCLDEQIDTHLYLRNAVLRYRRLVALKTESRLLQSIPDLGGGGSTLSPPVADEWSPQKRSFWSGPPLPLRVFRISPRSPPRLQLKSRGVDDHDTIATVVLNPYPTI